MFFMKGIVKINSRASRPRTRSASVPSENPRLPASFSHLYRGPMASSQPFQLGLATQVRVI